MLSEYNFKAAKMINKLNYRLFNQSNRRFCASIFFAILSIFINQKKTKIIFITFRITTVARQKRKVKSTEIFMPFIFIGIPVIISDFLRDRKISIFGIIVSQGIFQIFF